MNLHADKEYALGTREKVNASDHPHQISLLVRDPIHLGDARNCADAFGALGTQVQVICLCRSPMELLRWPIQPLLDRQIRCYTDSQTLAHQHHLKWLSRTALARHLKNSDWVIPL